MVKKKCSEGGYSINTLVLIDNICMDDSGRLTVHSPHSDAIDNTKRLCGADSFFFRCLLCSRCVMEETGCRAEPRLPIKQNNDTVRLVTFCLKEEGAVLYLAAGE